VKLSFRRPTEPAGPSQDQIIADLSHDKAALRAELDKVRGYLADADATISWQHQRMRDMAKQILGSQAVVARFLKATEWMLVDRGVQLPPAPGTVSTVDDPAVMPHECLHLTVDHGQWGCTVGSCECSRPRHALDRVGA
jgi:hypothetical protein